MKMIAMLTRQRSEEEKERRRKYGDKGARFKSGKLPKVDLGGVVGTITTMVTKDLRSLSMKKIALNTAEEGICRTLLATYHKVGSFNVFEHDFPAVMEIDNNMEGINVLLTPEEREYIIRHSRVRKLSPRDCMRLMGVSDEDFDKMRGAGISDTQLYKLAGNSIVVPVLEGIFTQMFRKDSEALF